MANEFIAKVLSIIDSSDATSFSELFAEDGRMVFGNMDPMIGRAAIAAGVGGFFTTIKGLEHSVINEWVINGDLIIELSVSYERLDGKVVAIPVTTIWHVRANGLIDNYRVYFDLTPVLD